MTKFQRRASAGGRRVVLSLSVLGIACAGTSAAPSATSAASVVETDPAATGRASSGVEAGATVRANDGIACYRECERLIAAEVTKGGDRDFATLALEDGIDALGEEPERCAAELRSEGSDGALAAAELLDLLASDRFAPPDPEMMRRLARLASGPEPPAALAAVWKLELARGTLSGLAALAPGDPERSRGLYFALLALFESVLPEAEFTADPARALLDTMRLNFPSEAGTIDAADPSERARRIAELVSLTLDTSLLHVRRRYPDSVWATVIEEAWAQHAVRYPEEARAVSQSMKQ